MKKLFISIIALISVSSFAQLYVSSNNYVFVRDNVLYVNQGINLQTDGNIYLRNEAQLVQGTLGTSTNVGAGKLSVFQEGTSDNFDYNYWSSPIGNASASVGNEPFGITLLNRPTTLTASTQAIALPYDYALNGVANPLQIASRWVYRFVASSAYAQWIYAGGTTTILPGEGFTMKGTSGTDNLNIEGNGVLNNPGGTGAQRYDFRGKPNDGNIPVTVALNNSTLTGNPYPSALHVNAFLLDPLNTSINRIAYYWEQDKSINSHYLDQYRGGYGTYAPTALASTGIYVPAYFNSYNADGSLNTTGTVSSGSTVNRKYAPIGQGFMVYGTANGTVTLRNSHRAYYKESGPFSGFERNSNAQNSITAQDSVIETSHIRINTILNNEFTKQIALAFLPEATDGIDPGIDAISFISDVPNDTYFFLDNTEYTIQGIPFDVSKRVPLGVKSSEGSTLKFYVAETVNFDESQDVFIYDALDESYHSIKNSEYEVTMPAGVFNNRFEVTFTDNSALGVPEINTTNFMVSQNNALETLTIHNPKLRDVQTVSIFDIGGKRIFKKENLQANETYKFSTSSFSTGVYILKMTTKEEITFTQKVIISK